MYLTIVCRVKVFPSHAQRLLQYLFRDLFLVVQWYDLLVSRTPENIVHNARFTAE